MKKAVAILLCVTIMGSFWGCGAGNGQESGKDSSKDSAQTSGTDTEKDSAQEGGSGAQAESALAIMTAIWNSLPEDGKFAAFGGSNTTNTVENAPGTFDLSDTEGLKSLILLSDPVLDHVDDVASVIHMMNANLFTGAAFHVKDKKTNEAAEQLRDVIRKNQFMCGIPEKLVMASVGDYVVYAFGSEELLANFKAALTKQFSDAKILYDEPIG